MDEQDNGEKIAKFFEAIERGQMLDDFDYGFVPIDEDFSSEEGDGE